MSQLDPLKAEYIRNLEATLTDAAYALDGIADLNGFPADETCTAEELCGHAICAECGCLQLKRRNARLALAGAL